MSLIEESKKMYRAILAEKPATNPMVLQMKEFILNHFGHAGTQAIREVDKERVPSHYKKNPAPGNELKRFQHPNVKAPLVAQATAQATPKPKPVSTEAVKTEAAPSEELKADSLGKSSASTKESLPLTSSAAAVVAGKSQGIDFVGLVDMSPKGIAALYPRSVIVEALKDRKVKYHSNGSDTQLAATLLQDVKKTD